MWSSYCTWPPSTRGQLVDMTLRRQPEPEVTVATSRRPSEALCGGGQACHLQMPKCATRAGPVSREGPAHAASPAARKASEIETSVNTTSVSAFSRKLGQQHGHEVLPAGEAPSLAMPT